jgi:hypothetical protein
MPTVPVTVIVEEEAMPRFANIAEAAVKAGLVELRQMPTIGQLTGRMDDQKLDNLAKVAGVMAVEAGSDTYQLAPPTSKDQ